MTEEKDLALVALLKAAEIEPSLPGDLLQKSFAIQRRHQFDRDEVRESSMQELKALLDAAVDGENSK
jgi:hypothetical protein